MDFTDLTKILEQDHLGQGMYDLIAELYPICRSITGNGFRTTLNTISRYIPLEIHEVPSGTQVFDWTVPKEWNIRDAYVKNADGEKVIDFQQSNLHIVSYSVPVRTIVTLEELKKHLHTLPHAPDWIPYRTSYYKKDWGFCLSHNQLLSLQDGEYEVCIDSTLENGSLTYGEFYIQGETPDEILISCHACHPSLCNDNLSGIAVATFLAHALKDTPLRYSYRFLFIPGTIGSITWLALNEAHLERVKHGLVMTCVGDAGHCTYKKSRRGDAEVDRVFNYVLEQSGEAYRVIDFFPYGYDERQYCSPGFNLPVGCFMRSQHGQFPEYHTSADNLSFVHPQYLVDSLSKCLRAFYILENNRKYLNQNPRCEPQLGRRGLYRAVGGQLDQKALELALLWVLNLSDGDYNLLDIAIRSEIRFETVKTAADLLLEHGLLAPVSA